MGRKHSIILVSSGIILNYDNIPEEKYRNYLLMNKKTINTTDFTVDGFPYKLQIEPTNICNLECPLCPVGRKILNRKPKHMRFHEFKSIIDDMEKYLLLIILWDWGEPFMNPELPKMIKYAEERGIKIITSTNAHFLHNEKYVKDILKSGLTNLIVAIDSLNEKDYEVYRRRGSLNKALHGLENLIRLKKELKSKTSINLRMVVMKQNEQEVGTMRKLARNIGVDIFTLKTLNPSCGLDAMDEELIPSKKKYRRYEYTKDTKKRIRVDNPCLRVWHMSNIYSNGDVVPCCYHFDGAIKVGNINEKPLTQIWNDTPYRNLRKKIYFQKNSINKCKECVINFKLAKKGEYPQVIYFNESAKIKFRNYFINKLRIYHEKSQTGRTIIKLAKRAKASM